MSTLLGLTMASSVSFFSPAMFAGSWSKPTAIYGAAWPNRQSYTGCMVKHVQAPIISQSGHATVLIDMWREESGKEVEQAHLQEGGHVREGARQGWACRDCAGTGGPSGGQLTSGMLTHAELSSHVIYFPGCLILLGQQMSRNPALEWLLHITQVSVPSEPS